MLMYMNLKGEAVASMIHARIAQLVVPGIYLSTVTSVVDCPARIFHYWLDQDMCSNTIICMYICIKGSGTYPCTILSKRFYQKFIKHQEKHKCISKDGASCCGYSGDRLGRFFQVGLQLVFERLDRSSRNNFYGQTFHIYTT